MVVDELIQASRELSRRVDQLCFSGDIACVYNPFVYAREPWERYLAYAKPKPAILFMGMNPGPWGMAQIGVPFGEIELAREWLKIDGVVEKPRSEHPKRPIEGFACARSEVSGRRLWGLFRERYETPEKFFADHFLFSFCPLVFMAESGRNITPDKIRKEERIPLDEACSQHLERVLEILQPSALVGIGAYAEGWLKRCSEALPVCRILHPSPASPAANRDWSGTVTQQMRTFGLWD